MDPSNLPQPYQPQPPAAQPGPPAGGFNPSQYDFITAPPQKPKKSLLPGSGSSKKQRIAIVAIGLIVLLIFFIILFSLLGSGSKSNKQQMITLLQQQAELNRVAQFGQQHAGNSEAKNLSVTIEHNMTSETLKLQATLKAQKIKVSTKQILAGKNAKTDSDLNDAISNGRFDDAFIQSIRNQLEEYKKSLKTAYSGTSSKSLKEQLNQDYKDVNLLLEQITGQPQT